MRPEISDLLRSAATLSDVIELDRRMSSQESHLRLVVVALVSVLQAYLRELLEEQADRLGNTWETLTELERRYVAVQTQKRLETYITAETEIDLADPRKVDALREAILECASWQHEPAILSRSAYRQKLDGFLQDNGSKTLDRVISRYSVCELSFFNWLNKFHPRYRGLEDSLDIIIATRNDVAHGTFKRRVTLREARVHIVLIYRLILKIESYILAQRDGSQRREPTSKEIAARAYTLWLSRREEDGSPQTDWLRAEQELRSAVPAV